MPNSWRINVGSMSRSRCARSIHRLSCSLSRDSDQNLEPKSAEFPRRRSNLGHLRPKSHELDRIWANFTHHGPGSRVRLKLHDLGRTQARTMISTDLHCRPILWPENINRRRPDARLPIRKTHSTRKPPNCNQYQNKAPTDSELRNHIWAGHRWAYASTS